jgi:MFS family permease
VDVSGAGVGALARERALEQPAAGVAPTAGRRARRNIRYLYLDMGWQGIILAGITTFLSVFLVRLGASPFLVGLLTSVPALVTIVLSVVFAPFLEGRRDLVRVVTLTRLGSRLCYLLIALVPFALTGDLVWLAPWVIVAIWGLSAVFSSATNPAFTAVLAEVVPPRQRPAVNGGRWAVVSLVTAITAALFGRLLDAVRFPLNFQFLFVLSFLAGLASIYYFDRIEVPPGAQLPVRLGAATPLRYFARLARDSAGQPAFASYVLTTFVYRLGLNLPLALFPLYWVDEVHASNSWIGFSTTATYGTLVVGYFLWGRAAQRHGHRRVLLLSSAGAALYPLLTPLVRSPEWLIPVAIVYGAFAGGIDVSFFEGLLEASPPEQRASFAAINASFANLAVLVGPIAGTAVAGVLGIRAGFVVAGGLCLLGTLLFHALSVGRHRAPHAASAETAE